MSLLNVSGLSFEYSAGTSLLTGVNFQINPDDRVAVVGPNGSGKSTLIQLLTGDLEPVNGTIARRRGLSIEVSEQNCDPKSVRSGGEQNRERLARILGSSADLIVLDEPTNHLDLHAREWLERKLFARRGACLFASHDRAFLEAVADRVIEVERGKVKVYDCGYAEYRRLKSVREAQEWADYEAFERRKSAMELAARKREQLAVKVATAPSGARHSKDFYARKASKVAQTGRMLRERVSLPDKQVAKPWEEQPIDGLTFERVRRAGDVVLSVESVSKSFRRERPLFHGLSFYLRRGDRLVIAGSNGSGKTTLLNILAGLLAPDQGHVRRGANVEIASIAQILDREIDHSLTPLQVCGTDTTARTLLACLKLPVVCLNRPLRTLSGGERTKVALARMLNSPANLLLLDEPTNHLEVEAQEAFEQALSMYPGTVVAISHDRAFIESLGPECIELNLDDACDRKEEARVRQTA
jgi:ATPase subunit of ABC transporter with duplicated ATPase domains